MKQYSFEFIVSYFSCAAITIFLCVLRIFCHCWRLLCEIWLLLSVRKSQRQVKWKCYTFCNFLRFCVCFILISIPTCLNSLLTMLLLLLFIFLEHIYQKQLYTLPKHCSWPGLQMNANLPFGRRWWFSQICAWIKRTVWM